MTGALLDLGYDCVRAQSHEGYVEVTITRPQALNALNGQVLAQLRGVFEKLLSRPLPASVIITGEGDKAFVAGADITQMSALSAQEAQQLSILGHEVFALIERFPSPVLAAVNGFALGGGCELALACDIVYAAEHAKFGQPEVKLGLMPGFGGTLRLPRKIGPVAAAEWIFTGEIYTALQAKELGLVREVVPGSQLLPHVRSVAQKIAARAPLAVAACKRALAVAAEGTATSAALYEQTSFASLFHSADMREGTRAFIDKRQATFEGR